MLIKLDSIDSTNNYAMQLIDGNKAQHGLTIVAAEQTNGRGQRGRQWGGTPGDNVLMSLIAHPTHTIEQQFLFNAAVSVSIALAIQKIAADADVKIKWPNDIIIGDKKAGGILIENILRGQSWLYAIIGVGLNVNQHSFQGLPHATSLKKVTGKTYDIDQVVEVIRTHVLHAISHADGSVLNLYNQLLFRKEQKQTFITADGESVTYTITGVNTDGSLRLMDATQRTTNITHGELIWEYSSL